MSAFSLPAAPGLLAVLTVLAVVYAAAPAVAGLEGNPAGQPARRAAFDPQRVIIRLADPGGARANLMASVRGAPLTLDARHERVVVGLQAIHSRSLLAARGALGSAARAGALREIDRLWIVNAVVAEVDPAWIERLEADPAIAAVFPDRQLTLGGASRPLAGATGPALGVNPILGARQVLDPVEELVRIRVPEVWAQGITGQGAIVANIDSGVNGEDDTFGDRWRGRLAGSDATWLAPISLGVFPNDDFSLGAAGHGTATMGILTGGEETYGVAFGATWIAGDGFDASVGLVSVVLKIFEWMTDPDGDPTTRSDVPDVINNSYGLTNLDDEGLLVCDRIFDDAIDAVEAAGAIVVWSAGNAGAAGVTSPGSRADSPVNAFSVGSVDADDQLAPLSGRGPSACGGPHATKPEVVAPGEGATSRNLFNQFTTVRGTSFATPMVAGVLALMRSKDPLISPEEAKTILIQTARDLGPPGDDNAFGHGLVDAAAALARVDRPSQPLARLVGFRPRGSQPAGGGAGKLSPAGIEDALVVRPGAVHELVPHLTNHGPAIPATTATLASPTAGVATSGSVMLEAAAAGAAFGAAPGESFRVELDGSVPPGSDIVLDLTVQGAPIGPFRMVLKAGEPIGGEFATHDAGQVLLTVTNFGGLGFYTGLQSADFVLRGDGFRFPPSSPNWLFHGSFIAGTGPDRVSDDIPYGSDTQSETDWFPLAGFPLTTESAAGGQRITVGYDDRHAIRPLDLRVRQESYAFGEPGEDTFVLVQYILTNTASGTLGGLRVGLFADWDLPDSSGEPRETAGWDPSRRLGFVEGSQADQPALGVVWLDDVPLGRVTYTAFTRAEIIASTAGNPPAARTPVPAEAPDLFEGEFSDAEKWDALASGQSRTAVTQAQDVYQLIGVGPLTLAAGATDTVAVALVAGSNRGALQQAADAARETYFTRVLGISPPPPPPPPAAVALDQNFPNPFRAGKATTIQYAIPDPGDGGSVEALLAIYDILGRRVRTLVEGEVMAGENAATWDGRDERGDLVPSGIYVAQLVAADTERTIRLLIVR
ncbi:MAG TPA: S8 family serine peptidase [Gemmatimonadota bacterium]|nr:S8 family serine peptidase [Gemmatimonadota bacterium]